VKRVRLVHWKEEEAAERVEKLTALGYCVDYESLTPDVLKAMRDAPPDAVVVDLGRLPSHGRDIGVAIRSTKATRAVPLVFVGGGDTKVAKIRELLPDAVFTNWASLEVDLAKAIEEPPEDPVVPASRMAGYSGTPLPKKLGIGEGSELVLYGAPSDFSATLGELPPGVTIRRGGKPGDVNVWFVNSCAALEDGIVAMIPCGRAGRLWIAWPKKSSGVGSDLSQAVVRERGLAHGLVDFKIAAIDATWSGLCFTERKDGAARL
jgi:hypothetical protein